MGKLNEHRVRINSQVQVSKSRIEKGMILRIRYSPILSGKTRDSAREYMILVLNPFFKKKVHALTLDNFSNVRLNQLAEDVGLVDIQHFNKMFLVDYKFSDTIENKFLLEDRDGKTKQE